MKMMGDHNTILRYAADPDTPRSRVLSFGYQAELS